MKGFCIGILVCICLFVFAGLGFQSEALDDTEERITYLETEILRLSERLELALFATCVNEGVLREQLGAEAISFEGCLAEYQEYWDYYQSQLSGDSG